LSWTVSPEPFASDIEEELWHICDYSWLINSARRSSTSNDVPRPSIETFATPSRTTERSVQSPDFETLLEGALSFDFGLLEQIASNGENERIFNC
jgi:hypothetical protein